MAQSFKETAHLRTNKEKFDENYERIFGTKNLVEKNILEITINQSFGDFKIYVIFESKQFKKEIVLDYDDSFFNLAWLTFIVKTYLKILNKQEYDLNFTVNATSYIDYHQLDYINFCEVIKSKLYNLEKNCGTNLERLLS